MGDKAAYSSGRLADALNVVAIGPGSWSANLAVNVTYASQAVQAWKARNDKNPNQAPAAVEQWFKVTVEYKKNGEVVANELFDNLSHIAGSSNNAVTVINRASHLIRIWWESKKPPTLPALSTDNADKVEKLAAGINWSGGADDDPQVKHFKGAALPPVPTPAGAAEAAPADLLGQAGQQMGLAALALIDEISLLIAADEVNANIDNARQISTAVIEQCERLRDRFAIISVDQGQSDVTDLRPFQDTKYGAFYYPWIKVFDPSINAPRLIPPSGHIAGIIARTDIERGVHKAPANEVVRGALDLEFPVTNAMQGMLNPRGVNCICDFRGDGRGIRLWGARTMSSDPEWRYVNVRRLFLFVEESIEEGTQWVVFEPNDEATWAAVRRNITSFLISVWRSGALTGMTQDEAFFVRCDRTTMTQDDIDNGRLICVIGIAPVKPAEFVIFRISQNTAEAGP